MEDVRSYKAEDLFKWITDKNEKFNILDVRNEEEFAKFKVEAPFVTPVNVPYIDFTLDEEESVKKVPRDKKIRVVCSKEGSAKYVSEILAKSGFKDVAYLEAGIKSWGNVLVPKLVNPGEGYAFYQCIRPGKASCSYALIYKGEMFVFESTRNIDFYKNFAKKQNTRTTRLFQTHLQADFITGDRQLSQDTGAEVMVNEIDYAGAEFKYTPIKDGETVTFSQAGGPVIEVIHTPGHTPGSTSYLIDSKYMLTGDTVFITSVGRPDLGGKVEEWAKMLFDTLKNKISNMDDNLLIFPTHYIDWGEANEEYIFTKTLKEIKERNAHIYGIEKEEEFIKFIKDNMREQPESYARIREFNKGLLEVSPDEQEILDIGKHECAASKK